MTRENPTPTPTAERLFTWVDVDEYFAELATLERWPDWLLEVSAFWDSVELKINNGVGEGEVWEWLTSTLGNLRVDPNGKTIILDSAGRRGHPLPVSLLRVSEPIDLDRAPRWKERRIVSQLGHPLPRPASPLFAPNVQICAFHSFKGGVGRTLHCLALARQLVRSQAAEEPKVLLVDADMEAPGITWMADSPDGFDFALEDFLALLHGSRDGDISEPLTLAEQLLDNQERDGVLVLPARRSLKIIGPPSIEPAHLPTPQRSPYFLTESLAELAVKIRADVVLVDLRAGASELSAPFLLDPRVLRVFVTTTDDQSVHGTRNILRQIGRRAPSRESTDPRCAVLVTQFDERRHDKIVFDVVAELMKEMARVDHPEGGYGGSQSDPVADRVENRFLFSPFDQGLLALPGAWDDVCKVIDRHRLGEPMKDLVDWLRIPPSAADTASMADSTNIVDVRRRIHEAARSLVDVRSASGLPVFLPTAAVTRLFLAHRTEAPITCLVGAPGAGKTFTYLRMCASKTWAGFADSARVSRVHLDSPLVPVFASSSLGDYAESLRAGAAEESARKLRGSGPVPASRLKELIEKSLEKDLNEAEWSRVWLTCMAWSAGLAAATVEDVEDELTALARDRRAIFVIDGLEDLFQHVAEREREQRAIRALLTECAAWLRKLRGNPLGLVVFARHDLVLRSSAISDVIRFVDLGWSRSEALRLVAWVCTRAEVRFPLNEAEIASADEEALSRSLVQLWGYRFDSEMSRRVRSEDWFFAALSNFNQRTQPGDVIAFLAKAADKAQVESQEDRQPGRLLTSSSMRAALREYSLEKIASIERENPSFGKLLDRLRKLRPQNPRVSFKLDEVGLDRSEARLLQFAGALFHEGDLYWLPEIYCYGLGFEPSGILPLRWLRSRL